MTGSSAPVAGVVERIYREHRARMLAALVRVLGDFELAEDALQDACAQALLRWPETVPDDPVAWLLTVARNRAVDRLRRMRLGQEKHEEAAERPRPDTVTTMTDFGEQRLVSVGDERLSLIFTQGYTAAPYAPEQRLLRLEAIRLGKLIASLMPDEPEALGLVALLLLHDSRAAARYTDTGDVVLLAEQDRSRWDRTEIAEAVGLLDRALRHDVAGPYQLQAAIAALHANAPSTELTDWPRIAALYDRLLVVASTPVVALNHAVAVAMASTPADGLALIDRIDGLEHYHLLHATRADLLRRLGRPEQAAAAYRRAHELATNPADRRFLAGRLLALDGRGLA